MDDPAAILRAQLDEDQAWAEACQGHHWQWEGSEDDQVVTANPVEEEHLADGGAVSLRSVETEMSRLNGLPPWPAQPLPISWPIYHAEEVTSSAGGHIVRHDPARTLREVKAMRKVLDIWPDPFGNWTAAQADAARAMKRQILKLLAEPYHERP